MAFNKLSYKNKNNLEFTNQLTKILKKGYYKNKYTNFVLIIFEK